MAQLQKIWVALVLSLSLAGAPAVASVLEMAKVRATGVSASAAAVSHNVNLTEEEVSDVSLATFYVIDRENAGPKRAPARIVVGAGCAGCAGCFGCAGGCWSGTNYSSSVFGDDAAPAPPKHKRAKPAHSSGLAKPGSVPKSS